ncbi:MAG TPA: ABC transporter substrate-binding protein [Chloroflexota bacterium]|nr:ABC transporter substrate-binding protein [Chloroflexota bacterium]
MTRPRFAPTRRAFLRGGLALSGLGLLSGCAPPRLPWQPSPVRRIGVLSNNPDSTLWDAFRAGLRELGYVEGQNISIDYRSSEEESDQYAPLTAELVGLNVECIVTGGGTASMGAKAVNTSIPMVAVLTNQDAVEGGLVANIARPEGNITGLAGVSGLRLHTKLPEILKEAIPDVGRVGVLASAQWRSAAEILAGIQEAAARLGLLLEIHLVQDRGAIEPALSAMRATGTRGLVFLSPLLNSADAQIASLALAHRLPAISPDEVFPRIGGLMGYTVGRPALYRRAAFYVDRILKGAKPADLPMERPSTFDFIINLKTARALGLTIPQSVLQQATELIQ